MKTHNIMHISTYRFTKAKCIWLPFFVSFLLRSQVGVGITGMSQRRFGLSGHWRETPAWSGHFVEQVGDEGGSSLASVCRSSLCVCGQHLGRRPEQQQ